jgi:hypothetical protein
LFVVETQLATNLVILVKTRQALDKSNNLKLELCIWHALKTCMAVTCRFVLIIIHAIYKLELSCIVGYVCKCDHVDATLLGVTIACMGI